MSVSRDDFSIAFRSALLQRGGAQKFSILSLVILAIFIFFLDVYGFAFIKITRSVINDVVFRVSYIASSPARILPNANKGLVSHLNLKKENEKLKQVIENYKSLDLVSVPTQRYEEGIAYSSRNEKLSKKQIQDFNSFHKQTKSFLSSLEKSLDVESANLKANEFMTSQDIDKFDYFELRNDTDLSFVGNVSKARLFYAIYKGKIRLIDNLKV